MAWTTPRTWVVGEVVTAANMNAHVRDNTSFLANPPKVSLTNSGTTSPVTATWTALNFDTEAFDTDGMHSTSSNTSRITVGTAGTYLFIGNASFTGNATGLRGVGFRKNGTGTAPSHGAVTTANAGAGDWWRATHSALVAMTATDYMELMVYQSSGAGLSTIVSDGTPRFEAYWVSL